MGSKRSTDSQSDSERRERKSKKRKKLEKHKEEKLKKHKKRKDKDKRRRSEKSSRSLGVAETANGSLEQQPLSLVQKAALELARLREEEEAKEAAAEKSAQARADFAARRAAAAGPDKPRPDTLPLAPSAPVWMRVKGLWMQQEWDPATSRMRLTPASPDMVEQLEKRELQLAELRNKG